MKRKNKLLRVGTFFLLFSFIILSFSNIKAMDSVDNKDTINDLYDDSFNKATTEVNENLAPIIGDEAPDFNIIRGEKNNIETVIDSEKINSTNTIDLKDLETMKREVNKPVLPQKGGNKKSVNIIATPPSKARGTVVENVDQNAENITPKEDNEKKETEEPKKENKEENSGVPMRQFVTFTSQGGKEFHLIISHDKDVDNVQMLTEVSEQDLLNMIQGQSVEDKQKEAAEELKRLEEEQKAKEEKIKSEEEQRLNTTW